MSGAGADARVLVTGAEGQLGAEVVAELGRRGVPCRGIDVGDVDLTDAAAVAAAVAAYRPTAVVHCAAYTNVDRAEDEPDACTRVNVVGSENLAAAARDVGAALLYMSTDYVFGGEGTEPFEVDAPRDPRNIYGFSKAAGEDAVRRALPGRHWIVRTSWVVGPRGRSNFVKTMLRLAATRDEVAVVDDQIGSPTYAPDLAVLVCDVVAGAPFGEYHATNEGFCSWAEFAQAVFETAGLPTRVRRIRSEEYPAKAVRPKNSRLSKASLNAAGLARLPHWRDALRRYLADFPQG